MNTPNEKKELRNPQEGTSMLSLELRENLFRRAAQSGPSEVGSFVPNMLTDQLARLILLMPEMLEQIRVWGEQPEIPTVVRRIYSILSSYIHDPDDLCHDSENGLLGYLDDAYLAAKAYGYCVVLIGFGDERVDSRVRYIGDRIPGWIEAVQRALPLETSKLDVMFDLFLKGNTAAFSDLLAVARKNKASEVGSPSR